MNDYSQDKVKILSDQIFPKSTRNSIILKRMRLNKKLPPPMIGKTMGHGILMDSLN